MLAGCGGRPSQREDCERGLNESAAIVLCLACVSWQLETWWDACMYVWVGVCLGVGHPSGDEQLFYQQVQRVSPLGLALKNNGVYVLSLRGRGGIRSSSPAFTASSRKPPWCH